MKHLKQLICILFFAGYTGIDLPAQILDHSWANIVYKSSDEWFASDEAKAVAENVLLYQRSIGGWPKNTSMQKPISNEDKKILKLEKSNPEGCTTDNGATILEMTFLSNIYRKIPDARYERAFLYGLDYLLEAQYKNGGWPQFYPLRKGYYSHITYNDNSMVNIMGLLHEIIKESDSFSVKPDSVRIQHSRKAFEKGIECILKTQYLQNGVLTGWCAQYDEKTFLPAKARAYELPSLSGQESAGIVHLLMGIENPSREVKKAINAAVTWFEKTKITGLRQERYVTEDGVKEKRLIPDPLAPPLWARFMELDDNTPFFCDRDGIKKASIMEIGQERRNGYGWYSEAPQSVLKKYPLWKAKWDNNEN